MIPGELADLARKPDRAIRNEKLSFADPAWIQQDLSGRRKARVILIGEAEVELSQRDPARFAAPPHMNDLLTIRQELPKPGAGSGSGPAFKLAQEGEGTG